MLRDGVKIECDFDLSLEIKHTPFMCNYEVYILPGLGDRRVDLTGAHVYLEHRDLKYPHWGNVFLH